MVGIPARRMFSQAGIGTVVELEAQRWELRIGNRGSLALARSGDKRATGLAQAQPALDAAKADLKGAHRVGTRHPTIDGSEHARP